MAFLSWISDDDLIRAFTNFVNSVNQGKSNVESKFDRNVIDPFGAAFTMALFDMSVAEWRKSEINRQIDKALSNAVGVFHQQILSCISGWCDLHNTNQVDLVNDNRKIIAELKNKHNTLNAAGATALYKKLSELVNSKSSKYKGYTAYYVTIIPKTAHGADGMFYPSDNALGVRCKQDEKIRIIDGKRFYALASGVDTALEELFTILPDVLKVITKNPKCSLDPIFAKELFQKAYEER